MNNERLIELYRQMAEHTLPQCKYQCRVPLSCCAPEYCELAISWAKDKWGVELQPTGHPKLPLMGPEGCIAAPHLRPICTMHTCAVNSFGGHPTDLEWNGVYFQIREEIEQEEWRRNDLPKSG